jgi:hypothetical protein
MSTHASRFFISERTLSRNSVGAAFLILYTALGVQTPAASLISPDLRYLPTQGDSMLVSVG